MEKMNCKSPSSSRSRFYRRDGPLSPLRSPLNRKLDVLTSNRSSSKDSRPDRYTSERKPTPRHSWADLADEFDQQQETAKKDLNVYQERRSKLSQSEEVSDEVETDESVLMRRQKQIDYGKCGETYEKYVSTVPRYSRKLGIHPRTPNKFRKCSRRCFDGMVKAWKLQLHRFLDSDMNTPIRAGSVNSNSSNNATPSTEGAVSSAEDASSPVFEEKASRKQLAFGVSANNMDLSDEDL